MTVSNQTNHVLYLGNGSATAFPTTFRFFENGDVRAYLIDNASGARSLQVEGTHYTLSGAGEPEVNGSAPGVLTMLVAPTAAQSLYLERVLEIDQQVDILNQGDFFPETHEDVFDRLTMLLQQVDNSGRGAIRVAIGDPEPSRLPAAISRANLLMGFDSNGDPIPVAPVNGSINDFALNLANSSDPAKGAGMWGYRGRNGYERLSEIFFSKDFGVASDGVTNDTINLQAAINTAAAAKVPLVLASGTTLISGVAIPSNLQLYGDSGAIIKLINNTDASLLTNSDPGAGNSNVSIRNIELDGNKANQGSISRPVVLFKKCDHFLLQRVIAHDAKITTYTTDTYDQILFVDSSYCQVLDCESYNSDQGGLGFYGTGGHHQLLRNYVHNCPAGIEGTYQTDSLLDSNEVRVSTAGLISWNGLRNRIQNNLCVGSSGGAGIVCGHSGTPDAIADGSYVLNNTIQDVFSYGVTVFASADVLVQGNKITRASGNATHSIFINTGCARVQIRNNDIADFVTTTAAACNIFVDTCADVVVSGNRCRGATGGGSGDGIRLFGACTNPIIEGNTIVSAQGDGIETSTTSTSAVIRSNQIRTITGLGMRIAGDNSVLDGNLIAGVTGAQGILINSNNNTVNGNRVSGVTSGAGIFNNATDFNAIVGNTVDSSSVGISLPTGSDNCTCLANVLTASVTTKISAGTNTGTKIAHNIGVATHDI